MKVILLDNGKLQIQAENVTDSFILELWVDKNHNKKIIECIKVDITFQK